METENLEIIEKIMQKVDQKVHFKYPNQEGDKQGILKDRFVFQSIENNSVPYWDVIDLIEFPDEMEKEWIRISYYRKPNDRLVWGGQTSITEPISVWENMLAEVVKEKPWFRKLIENSIGKSKVNS